MHFTKIKKPAQLFSSSLSRFCVKKENSSIFSKFCDLWKRTFPGDDSIQETIEKRKADAAEFQSKFKEPTEEEIELANASIPEWKRFSLVIVSEEEEPLSIFERSKKQLVSHVLNSQAYDSYLSSPLHEEVVKFQEEFEEVKRNLNEEINNSQAPFIVASRDILVVR